MKEAQDSASTDLARIQHARERGRGGFEAWDMHSARDLLLDVHICRVTGGGRAKEGGQRRGGESE